MLSYKHQVLTSEEDIAAYIIVVRKKNKTPNDTSEETKA